MDVRDRRAEDERRARRSRLPSNSPRRSCPRPPPPSPIAICGFTQPCSRTRSRATRPPRRSRGTASTRRRGPGEQGSGPWCAAYGAARSQRHRIMATWAAVITIAAALLMPCPSWQHDVHQLQPVGIRVSARLQRLPLAPQWASRLRPAVAYPLWR